MKKLIFFFAIFLFLFKGINAQKLPAFDADLGKTTVLGHDIRIPYTYVLSYFGYIKPSSEPDEERNGKKYYYLYVWIPVAAPEIGIRMISPIPKNLSPGKNDYQMDEYSANFNERKTYFDTWISFERADGVFNDTDFVSKAKNATWTMYAQNDDSGELPAQPSGKEYNSLMRITSETSNPEKAIVMGLYRIGFTSFKTGEVQGSFIAQIGAPLKLPGTYIAKYLESLKIAMDSK
ncbi:MAG: LipL32 family surface lipoprotein [Ignavibacteriae bacterium]|nr:LipL32 family surface lipoprotein [Ignavibacteriota bacterium]